MRVIVKAEVIYACDLDRKQVNALKNKLKEERNKHKITFDMDKEDACCAVMDLYCDPDTNFKLYKDYVERDFSTEEVQDIEFNDDEEEENFFEEINENA